MSDFIAELNKAERGREIPRFSPEKLKSCLSMNVHPDSNASRIRTWRLSSEPPSGDALWLLAASCSTAELGKFLLSDSPTSEAETFCKDYFFVLLFIKNLFFNRKKVFSKN